MTTPISYTAKTAAEATSLSIDVIKRAIRSGDIRATRPKVNGREIVKDVIASDELRRWVESR